MTDWRPILVGEPAERARRVVDEIAAELGAIEPPTPGLVAGASGLALFFAYYGDVTGDERAYGRATALIERASAMIADGRVGASLSTGIAGIGWTIEYLAGDPDAPEDANGAIDDVLDNVLANWRGPYDLIGGLAGIAVYAFGRLPRPGAARLLERIVAQLERTCEAHGDDRTWHTAREELPDWQAQHAPTGYYNLGLAHGVPALVSVLARVVAAGIATDRARPLLDGAAAWLLARQGDRPGSRYGAWIAQANGVAQPTRSAWCYGDPGVACALLGASEAVDNPAWRTTALDLMRGVAERVDAVSLDDAALCHGALGLALIFARFFQATGDPGYRDAAATLVDRAMRMRRPGEPIAGFQAVGGNPPTRDANPGLLEGAAGIGLALLALSSDIEPAWDRVLLLP